MTGPVRPIYTNHRTMKPKEQMGDRDFSFLKRYEAIDPDKDWQKVRARMERTHKTRRAWTWRAAAAAILVLAAGYLIREMVRQDPPVVRLVAENTVKEVRLPDGSVVVMNRGAVLSHPESFDRRKRTVNLSGEAYFEVQDDPSHPFEVLVEERARVEVLGTSFNVQSGKEDKRIRLQVLEGRVAFSPQDKKFMSIVLEKNEQAVMSDGRVTKEPLSDRNFLSWKTGILYFEQTPLHEVARKLSEHFDQRIAIDSSVPDDLTFTSTIDNQDLESVLEELYMVLGLDHHMDDRKVILKKPR